MGEGGKKKKKHWTYSFEFLPAVNESSCCFTSSPAFGIVSLFPFLVLLC